MTGPGNLQNPIKSAGTYHVLTAKAECTTKKKDRGSVEDQSYSSLGNTRSRVLQLIREHLGKLAMTGRDL